MATDFLDRCDTLEEGYEFMLAYAGQGLLSEEGSSSGAQVRSFLRRMLEALDGLADSCTQSIRECEEQPLEKYQAFLAVLERDAQNASAATQVVLAQPSISSQLIDNLNASSHLRAVLTDLFLLGEVVRTQNKPLMTGAQE